MNRIELNEELHEFSASTAHSVDAHPENAAVQGGHTRHTHSNLRRRLDKPKHKFSAVKRKHTFAADGVVEGGSSAVKRKHEFAADGVVEGVQLPPPLRRARKLPECEKFACVFGPDFYAMPTFGEGSCFFHALAAAIVKGYDKIKDSKKRAAVGLALRDSIYHLTNEQMYHDAVSYVEHKYRKHKAERPAHAPPVHEIPPFREFKARLQNKTVWADLVMISFVAFTFGYNLLFWSDMDCQFYYGCDQLELKHTHPTVFILWRDRTHFELIVHITSDGTVERQFHWNLHSELLKRVENEYLGKNITCAQS
jgi:hypothetical protein